MWTVRAAIAFILLATAGHAQERLIEAKASFKFNGVQVTIARGNADAVRRAATFVSADDACGGPCIAPMQVAAGVDTLGESEVLDFLVTQVAEGHGLMVDARVAVDRVKGFIPGTVSLPHNTLAPDNSFRNDILQALGARAFDGVFNFTDARSLLVYDNGPSSDDAGRLVENLLQAGYPAEMIRYYRGGMQVWSVLGFSIQEGRS